MVWTLIAVSLFGVAGHLSKTRADEPLSNVEQRKRTGEALQEIEKALQAHQAATEKRMLETVSFLAADALEGRGVGTKGLDIAADFIAKQFTEAGLEVKSFDGQPFQKFTMTTGANLGSLNSLALVGPASADGGRPRHELKLGDDFTPLAIGGSGKFDLPLVFVGYGITGTKEDYDDYDGINVKGKAVIILRHEPQQANPHSAFNGAADSRHGPFTRKVSNAYEHGAAAVIFCTDRFDIDKNHAQWESRWLASIDQLTEEKAKFKALANPSGDDRKAHETRTATLTTEIDSLAAKVQAAADPMLAFTTVGPEGGRTGFPVLFCRRAAIDPIVQAALGMDLAKLEAEIDAGPKPRSAELAGWTAVGETTVERQEVEVKNVVGVLEGEGPLANETIVVGAHYDHLGWGGADSAAPGIHQIHNGADDNASGATALVEVARILAARDQKLPRRVVFIAFTGEERGLVGSAHYVREPLFPLETTVAMLNMDMVGRLQDDKLIIYGTGTAKEFDEFADRAGKIFDFKVTKQPAGFGPSDHSSFFAQQIPVLHYFTGTHADYHRPTDDVEKLNIAGMRRIAELVAAAAEEIALTKDRPHYQEVAGSAQFGRDGDRPYFGSIPDFSQDKPGYALTGVAKDSPASRAGIRGGDVIIGFGDSQIGNLEDFDSALRKFKAGDNVPVTLKRGNDEVQVIVTLDPPR